MIRFIHTADVHFGMENYGKIDPKTGIHTRLLDFEHAFNSCIDTAIEQDVDLFVFSGDAYKTANPSPTQQRLFFRCLLRLFKAQIPVVIVIGNHDNPLTFGKAHALELFDQLPLSGFHVMAKPDTITVKTKQGPVQVVGIPWPSRASAALAQSQKTHEDISTYISQSVTSIIQHHAQQLDPDIPAILSAHVTVSSGVFSGSEKRAIYGSDPVFMPSQLAIEPFDYVALGHLHRYQNLNPGGIPVVYSGSLERIDFGERKEEKGFCLVTIDDNKQTTYEFIKTPIRTCIQLDITLKDDKSQTDQIIEQLKQHETKGAIIKIRYYLAADMKDYVDTQALQNVCADAQHLIGIFPMREAPERRRRESFNLDMDLQSMLTTYFTNKEATKQQASDLVKKALYLQEENQEDDLSRTSESSSE
jgi:exonuclease SbcD